MTIDWNQFTPWASLSGGVIIGLSAALFILVFGRILGISGIVGGLLGAQRNDLAWRVAFVAGLLAAPWAWYVFLPPVPVRIDAGWITLIIAGFLVGIGTRYGSGCTSGHGVCGLARLSLRSLVATLSFMGAGFITVYLVRHALS
ncbi:YeeE/YedE family protein [Alcaligenaceae bacterium CGII-47]|nr:YeeE/YedE family protein [Alcaligenaceae bacterium CGII-47]